MSSPPLQLPTLPEIGHPESYYARLIHRADRDNSPHAREAAKVGQYVTLAMDPHLQWDQKLRYFKHALRRHCQPPNFASDPVWLFYQSLADLVRRYAGREALRIALKEDESYARRVEIGVTRSRIESEAAQFFRHLLCGSTTNCPDIFNQEDWDQLVMVRNQWVTEPSHRWP